MKSMCSRVVDSVTLCLSLLMLLLGSCKNNGEADGGNVETQAQDLKQKMNQLVAEYRALGKDILAESDSFFIYADGTAFWYKDLYLPEKVLLKANEDFTSIRYYLSFTDDGHPFVEKYECPGSLSSSFFAQEHSTELDMYDDLPYEKEQIKLYGDRGLKFHRTINGSRDESGYDCVLYFSNPNTVFYVNNESSYSPNKRTDYAKSYASGLARALIKFEDHIWDYPFPYVYGANEAEGGIFRVCFSTDESGTIIFQSDIVEYYNEIYKDIKFSFDMSDFSTKSSALNILEKVLSAIQEKEREKEKEEIQSFIDKSITLEQLADETRNEVAFKDRYINKEIYIRCRLDGIKNSSRYKYVVRSYAVTLLGAWISDYNVKGYTNDRDFVNISYPQEVVMRAKLTYADGKNYEFEDCTLMCTLGNSSNN